jgi:hypothetical protein
MLATLLASAAAASNWASGMTGKCSRCVDAADLKSRIPIPIPKRAIFYFGQGEFAKKVRWNVIDLDSGTLTIETKTVGTGAVDQISSQVDPMTLAQIRDAATQAWHLPIPKLPPMMPPGSDIEIDVIIGRKLVMLPAFDASHSPPAAAKLITLVEGVLSSALEQPH